MFNLFKNKFTDEEIKAIDDQLHHVFTEEKMNEIVNLAKDKKCLDVDINIFLNVEERKTEITSDLGYILVSDGYQPIDYVPRIDEEELTLIIFNHLTINERLFKYRKKWIKKLSFNEYITGLVNQLVDNTSCSKLYNFNFDFDEEEKQCYHINKDNCDVLTFFFDFEEIE